jgi:hypothetical protein
LSYPDVWVLRAWEGEVQWQADGQRREWARVQILRQRGWRLRLQGATSWRLRPHKKGLEPVGLITASARVRVCLTFEGRTAAIFITIPLRS